MTHAVLAFGRMNPPTTGHEKFIKKTHDIAKKVGGKAHVVASHSEGNSKNPIPQKKKIQYLKKVAHPDVHVSGSSKDSPSILHHASKLHAAGHQHLHVVAGGDRKEEFHKTLHKYNGKSGAHGHYNFKSITVHSAGQRDPDSHDTKGVSGTKMREHAHNNDHESFKKGLPKALHPHKDEIMHHIKNVNEDIDTDFAEFVEEEFIFEAMTLQQRIKRRLIMRRIRPKLKRAKQLFKNRKVPEKNLKQRSRKKAIRAVRKRVAGKMGQNYNKLSAAAKMHVDKRVASRQNIVNRLAKKNMPTARKTELYRLTNRRMKESFEMFLENYVGSYGAARKTTQAGGSTFKAPNKVKGSGEASWSSPNKKPKPLPGSHKVGQRVKVNAGPHKGDHHIVTKDHGNGTYNLRPIGGVKNKYKGGEVKAASYHLSEAIIQVGEADKAVLKVDSNPHDNKRKDGKPLARKTTPTKASHTKHKYKEKTAKGEQGKSVSEQDIHNLYLKAEKGDFPLEVVIEVFIRGVEANLYEQQTPTQNGFGRVNSFIAKGAAYEMDKDLIEKMGFDVHTDVVAAADSMPKKAKKDKPSNPYMKLEGTPEAAAHARSVTPGQVSENMRMKMAKQRISQEKMRDAKKHDAMKDRARLRDTINKNRKTNPSATYEGKAMDDALDAISKAFTPEKNAERKKEMEKKRLDALQKKEDVKEASEKMLSSYASKASNASKHRGLPTKKVDNRYSGVALAHDKIAKAGKLGTTAMRVSKAKVAAKEDVDMSFENFVSIGSGVAPMTQARPRMVPKKKVQEAPQGKTFFQGYNDRKAKGIKSKPIDKDRFFGKKKEPEKVKEGLTGGAGGTGTPIVDVAGVANVSKAFNKRGKRNKDNSEDEKPLDASYAYD
tara:strand:- start:3766 stop:6414 length:2649 start_codon:yes stop_codon:yes gene_type:complete